MWTADSVVQCKPSSERNARKRGRCQLQSGDYVVEPRRVPTVCHGKVFSCAQSRLPDHVDSIDTKRLRPEFGIEHPDRRIGKRPVQKDERGCIFGTAGHDKSGAFSRIDPQVFGRHRPLIKNGPILINKHGTEFRNT